MAGIKQPIMDIMVALNNIVDAFKFVRIWNNQLERTKNSEDYSFPFPAAFVEVISPAAYDLLGAGFSESDVIFSIHIIHEMYDSEDGTMDQNLEVFDLRDKVLSNLAGIEPTGCGMLVFLSEQQDYDHDNLYHYIIDFKTSFIDSKTSPYDPDSGKLIDKPGPTGIQINVTTADHIEGMDNNTVFPHPGYTPYVQEYKINQ